METTDGYLTELSKYGEIKLMRLNYKTAWQAIILYDLTKKQYDYNLASQMRTITGNTPYETVRELYEIVLKEYKLLSDKSDTKDKLDNSQNDSVE